MMNLDEAIKHCEEVAEENEEIYEAHCRIYSKEVVERYPSPPCKKCAEEHRQLAEWLKELKAYKEQSGDAIDRKELLNDIDTAIKAANMDDAYSVGLRNGMRVIKTFIDDKEPEYEKCCHEESRSEIPNTCEDAISRQAVLDVTWEEPSYTDALNVLTEVREKVRALPSVTPQQRTGRWILTDDDFVYCSECEDSYYPRPIDASWYYCPHCGAKMEVEE